MGIGVAVAGLAVSAYSAYSQHQASNRAEDNQNQRAEQQQQLAEQARQDQLAERARWDAMFGPMEKNVARFYSQLDKNYIVTKGNDALQESYKISKDSLTEQLRANGLNIEDGVGTAAMTNLASNHAQARAELYATAESKAVGLQQQALASAPRRPGSGSQNALANQMQIDNGRSRADALALQGNQTDTRNLLDIARGAGAVYGEYQSQNRGAYTPTVAEQTISNPSLYSQIRNADGYMF